jgi:dTDP-4-dehydrorhamnose 3,5-epimerase
MRRDSPQCGQWTGVELSAENQRMLWIPPGFAHGFLVMSESADFLYKASAYYTPADEKTLAWDDPSVAIDWPLAAGAAPLVSVKDQAGLRLADAPLY